MAVVASSRGRDFLDARLLVTSVTMKAGMGTREGVACLSVVIESPARPAVGVVATGAIDSQAACVMSVIVAALARNRGIFKGLRAMAFLACHHGMETDKWEARKVVIEGNFATPPGLVMALLTTATELPFVGVILAVARNACGRQFVTIEITGVARRAFDIHVFTVEWKFGVFVVIELNRLPGLGGMTGLAIAAVPTSMRVLQAVARYAGPGQVLVALAGVAQGARNIAVRAYERKPRLAVIEGFHLAPTVFAVASITLLTQTSLVWINGSVTVDAAGRCDTEFGIFCMTAIAARSFMATCEREIGERVVECLPIQLNDIGCAPLVFHVAMLALVD
jgi:hypothetical protein